MASCTATDRVLNSIVLWSKRFETINAARPHLRSLPLSSRPSAARMSPVASSSTSPTSRSYVLMPTSRPFRITRT